MNYRILRSAQEDIDRILAESVRGWGLDGADRYDRLMLAAFDAVASTPPLFGRQTVADLDDIFMLPLRTSRRLVPAPTRVRRPRHIVLYRVARDGVVEILGLVHDRMALPAAARDRIGKD